MSALQDLSLYFFIVFGLMPFVMALFSEHWFWRLPLVCKVWKRKKEWDDAEVELPSAKVKLKVIRETTSTGSKITVAHHLAQWADDVRVRLFSAQVRGFAIVLVGWVLTVIPQTPPPTADQGRAEYVILRMLATYTLPVAGVAAMFEAYTLLWALYDQLRKYQDLLDPERIARRGS
jgi:hypothetical protein